MSKKLSTDEKTVTVQIRMPEGLRDHAAEIADVEGDGDISSYIRILLKREWLRYSDEKLRRKSAGAGR